jgi:plastocyanin
VAKFGSRRRGFALLATLAAIGVTAAFMAGTASADGRQLDGTFCSHFVSGSPFPPGLCIQLASDDQTVQGYFDSPGQISLRPGNYWLTVVDNSNFHNFTLQGPDGLDMDITPVPNGSTPTITETIKVHFEHGTYTLLCDADSHAADGMEITINVGGVGQVG